MSLDPPDALTWAEAVSYYSTLKPNAKLVQYVPTFGQIKQTYPSGVMLNSPIQEIQYSVTSSIQNSYPFDSGSSEWTANYYTNLPYSYNQALNTSIYAQYVSVLDVYKATTGSPPIWAMDSNNFYLFPVPDPVLNPTINIVFNYLHVVDINQIPGTAISVPTIPPEDILWVGYLADAIMLDDQADTLLSSPLRFMTGQTLVVYEQNVASIRDRAESLRQTVERRFNTINAYKA